VHGSLCAVLPIYRLQRVPQPAQCDQGVSLSKAVRKAV
jgi:hypothetical protein